AGIPTGVCRIQFRSTMGDFEFPPRGSVLPPIEITQNPSPYDIDLSSMGVVVLDVRGPGGEPYSERVQLRIAVGTPGLDEQGREVLQSASMPSLTPPYVLSGLKGGEYTVWPVLP